MTNDINNAYHPNLCHGLKGENSVLTATAMMSQQDAAEPCTFPPRYEKLLCFKPSSNVTQGSKSLSLSRDLAYLLPLQKIIMPLT